VEQRHGCLLVQDFDLGFFISSLPAYLSCSLLSCSLPVSCVASTSLPLVYQTDEQHLLASGTKEDAVV